MIDRASEDYRREPLGRPGNRYPKGAHVSHPTTDPELRAAYAACRRLQRRHDPTYWLATARLPREVRPAVHAVYGFVRRADEIVDGPGRPPDPAARRAALDAWEGEMRAGLRTGEGSDPVIRALADAAARHELPLEDELAIYMRSMRMDCGPLRVCTWAQLQDYMRGSAGSVGRIMAPLLGVPRARHDDFARMGAAFQLTNFLRDVREDWRLDRVYLPGEDRDRFGVGEEEIARGRATPGFRALMAWEVARARELFAGTDAAVAAALPGVRPAIRVARAVYIGVLDRIEGLGFDVLARRPRPPARAVIGALRA
jgi:phytoene synthase